MRPEPTGDFTIRIHLLFATAHAGKRNATVPLVTTPSCFGIPVKSGPVVDA